MPCESISISVFDLFGLQKCAKKGLFPHALLIGKKKTNQGLLLDNCNHTSPKTREWTWKASIMKIPFILKLISFCRPDQICFRVFSLMANEQGLRKCSKDCCWPWFTETRGEGMNRFWWVCLVRSFARYSIRITIVPSDEGHQHNQLTTRLSFHLLNTNTNYIILCRFSTMENDLLK